MYDYTSTHTASAEYDILESARGKANSSNCRPRRVSPAACTHARARARASDHPRYGLAVFQREIRERERGIGSFGLYMEMVFPPSPSPFSFRRPRFFRARKLNYCQDAPDRNVKFFDPSRDPSCPRALCPLSLGKSRVPVGEICPLEISTSRDSDRVRSAGKGRGQLLSLSKMCA